MRGAVLYGPRDVRFEERPEPKITKPTDAIIKISATCVCGSDLWPYRGIQPVPQPTPMGHEYCGIVEEIGSAVRSTQAPYLRVPLADGTLVASVMQNVHYVCCDCIGKPQNGRFRSQWKKSSLRIGLRGCTRPRSRTT